MNADSAVVIDSMSDEQSFRSEVNGSRPRSGHLSAVFNQYKLSDFEGRS
jgi:hypothetical protein